MTPALVLQYLERRQISVWAVAVRMEADPTHLRRVLTGRRAGSQALLRSVLETARSMPARPHRRQEDTDRLIEAATHVFFLRRGDFESAIFADPDEFGLYAPGPARKRGHLRKKNRSTVITHEKNENTEHRHRLA
jgi:hypothetical protein